MKKRRTDCAYPAPGYDICNGEDGKSYVCDMDVRKIWYALDGETNTNNFEEY